MEKFENNRRSFLKKMLTLSVFTASCPHILLGKLEPKLDNNDGNIADLVLYEIDTEIYKDLKELYKTIRIDVPKKEGGAPIRVMITKLDVNKDGAYLAVFKETCPHEGQKVMNISPLEKTFTCSGHGTVFNARGGYVWGPAAQDLMTYQFDWNGTNRFINILFPFYSPKLMNVQNTGLFYLKNNYPNPFIDNTTIEYGIENDSLVELEIADSLGRTVKSIKNGFMSAGHYTNELITSDMPKGLYLCTFKINGTEETSIKMIKQ